MSLTDEDVREILRIIDESDLAELRLDTEGFSLYVRKGGLDASAADPPAAPPAVSKSETSRARGGSAAAASSPVRERAGEPAVQDDDAESGDSRGSSLTEKPSDPSRDAGGQDGLVTIPAPMLGTFYRAEAPGKPPFVEVGSRVEPDSIVCIIEVMKMMNSVPAGVSGTVAEICADNAALVEYGQPLFRVQPS
jgi:acetyl-CoA carboxylase biotin carboxyl carrier protein